MAVDIPDFVPTSITQGTLVEWHAHLSDYPPADWTLSYEFRGASKLTVTATDDSGTHLVSISKTTSGSMLPGNYQYQAFVLSDDATERYMVDSGALVVVADYANVTEASDTDARTPARRLYDSLTKILENTAAVKNMPPDQLETMYASWKQLSWDVKREEDAEKVRRGGGQTRKVYTRFTEAL